MQVLPALPFPTFDALLLGAHRLSVLTDERLFEAMGVRVVFTGRSGGVSGGPYASLNCKRGLGDDDAAVAENRKLVCEAMGADPSRLIVPNQVHGTRVLEAERLQATGSQDAEDADAVVAGVAGVPVLMCFADCLPLVIVSPSGGFSVVHAGWRGAIAHIARAAALALARRDGADPASFNAYIGAHIRPECFEVGADVADRFRREFGDAAVPVNRRVSLGAAVVADLRAAGLDGRRIVDCGICTRCDSDAYFSYRASGGTCGRHAACAVRCGPEG